VVASQNGAARPVSVRRRQPARPAQAVEDDSCCWVCSGPVEKRNCKIICLVCGFMRDCSDP
jgi:hypothetical protein